LSALPVSSAPVSRIGRQLQRLCVAIVLICTASATMSTSRAGRRDLNSLDAQNGMVRRPENASINALYLFLGGTGMRVSWREVATRMSLYGQSPSFFNIAECAKALGCTVGVTRETPQTVARMTMPVIAYLESPNRSYTAGGRLVVVAAYSGKSVIAYDAATGMPARIPTGEFLMHWSGLVIARKPLPLPWAAVLATMSVATLAYWWCSGRGVKLGVSVQP